MKNVLTGWVLPLLIYSGPLLTYGPVMKLYPSRSRKRFFWASLTVHASAFLPLVVAVCVGNPDAVHALFLPATTGFLLFTSGLLYWAYLFILGWRRIGNGGHIPNARDGRS